MYISLFAITIVLTHFLLNPVNQVNQANPRFVGFTCRMKPLFEYLSGHFSTMTAISAQNPWQQSVAAGHIHFYLSTLGCQILIFHDSRQFVCLFILHFSLLTSLWRTICLFFHYTIKTSRTWVWQSLQQTIHLIKYCRSHTEVSQTSHEI